MRGFWLIFCFQLESKYHRSLSLSLGLDVTVGILPRKDVFCRDFILCAVATFWAMSLVGIYPGRASLVAVRFDVSCKIVVLIVQSGRRMHLKKKNKLNFIFDSSTAAVQKNKLYFR